MSSQGQLLFKGLSAKASAVGPTCALHFQSAAHALHCQGVLAICPVLLPNIAKFHSSFCCSGLHVPLHCCRSDNMLLADHLACNWQVSHRSQIMQRRWRWCLGSWRRCALTPPQAERTTLAPPSTGLPACCWLPSPARSWWKPPSWTRCSRSGQVNPQAAASHTHPICHH